MGFPTDELLGFPPEEFLGFPTDEFLGFPTDEFLGLSPELLELLLDDPSDLRLLAFDFFIFGRFDIALLPVTICNMCPVSELALSDESTESNVESSELFPFCFF